MVSAVKKRYFYIVFENIKWRDLDFTGDEVGEASRELPG